MASLQDIKGRIASVQSTLKITSAMKMVASAKLHKTQNESVAFTGYSSRLSAMVSTLMAATAGKVESPLMVPHEGRGKAIVVAMSSDMSLCGAFNHNAIRLLETTVAQLREQGFESVEVVPVGNKMAAAALKMGYPIKRDFGLDELGVYLIEEYLSGDADEVVMLYHHFVSVGSQKPVQEKLLPFVFEETAGSGTPGVAGFSGRGSGVSGVAGSVSASASASAGGVGDAKGSGQANVAGAASAGYSVQDDYIFEPSAAELLQQMVPYCVKTKVRAAILDNTLSEHAARMVAMQTATDNAKELLDELRLNYNKQRQQAITAELADIASSSLQ